MDSSNGQVAALAKLILEERARKQSNDRYHKIEKVLLLLASGVALTSALIMPGTGKLLRKTARSSESEWKEFNENYLKRTIKDLQKKRVVEIREENGFSEVKLTEGGKTRILKFGLQNLTVLKPVKWDGRFRMVFYDIFSTKSAIRDKFRHALLNAGFYKLQESVYIHAYPCEREIEFLRNYLGISGEVRIILAERIENDKEFRQFFGI